MTLETTYRASQTRETPHADPTGYRGGNGVECDRSSVALGTVQLTAPCEVCKVYLLKEIKVFIRSVAGRQADALRSPCAAMSSNIPTPPFRTQQILYPSRTQQTPFKNDINTLPGKQETCE